MGPENSGTGVDLEEESRFESAQSEFESPDNVESDALDDDFLFVEVFPSREFVHVHFPKHLLDFVVEDLVHHLLAVLGLEAVLDAEGLGGLDDDIELVGGGVEGELALDVEGDRLLLDTPEHVPGVGGHVDLVLDLLTDVDNDLLEDVLGILGDGGLAFEGILIDVGVLALQVDAEVVGDAGLSGFGAEVDRLVVLAGGDHELRGGAGFHLK